MMKRPLFLAVCALGLASLGPALGAGEGTAVGVNPDALVRVDAGERILTVGADVSVGELVVTGRSGQVQIVFDDQTRLVVGPSSSLLIETYLMASSNTAEKLAINALGGTFRFITGNSPKPAYSISTPTATIAVRGTEFDFVVQRSRTLVMLYEGALQLCNSAGDCEQVVKRCEVGAATRQQSALYVQNDPGRPPLSLEFRYAQYQSSLLSDFRVNNPGGCVSEGGSGSLNTLNGGTVQTPSTPPTPPPPPPPTRRQ